MFFLYRLIRDVLNRLKRDVLNRDGADQIFAHQERWGETRGLEEPTWWGNKMLCIQRFG